MKSIFKKSILLIMMFFYAASFSQVYTHNTRVKINTVNDLIGLDLNTLVVVLDSTGKEIQKITVGELLALDVTPTLDEVAIAGNTSFQDIIIDGFRKELTVQDLGNNDKTQIEANKISIKELSTLESITFLAGLIEMNNGSHTTSIRSDLATVSRILQTPDNSGTLALLSDIENIFNSDGTLTANRIVTMGTNDLSFDTLLGNLMKIEAGGNFVTIDNLGVNITTPTAPLHVQGTLQEASTYRGILIENPVDDNFWGAITVQAGTTANQRRYFEFKDHTGTRTNLLGFNALNSLIAWDAINEYHYISADSGSATRINSFGANAVILNSDTNATGSGGLIVLDGTANGTYPTNSYARITTNGIQSNNGKNIEALAPNNSDYTRLTTTASASYLRGSLSLNFLSNTNLLNFLSSGFANVGSINLSTGEAIFKSYTVDGSSGNGSIKADNLTSNKDYQLPNDSGTLELKSKTYTVATLPSGTLGDKAIVTDAATPTYLGTLTGGGAVTCPVFFDGTNWVSN